MKKVFDLILSIFIMGGLTMIVIGMVLDLVFQAKITNRLSKQEECIKLNGDFYCKVDK